MIKSMKTIALGTAVIMGTFGSGFANEITTAGTAGYHLGFNLNGWNPEVSPGTGTFR